MKSSVLATIALLATGASAAVVTSSCGNTGDSTSPTPEAILDLTGDVPVAPEGGLQLLTPKMTIKAHEEKMWCTVLTYSGPEVGIQKAFHYQVTPFGHHLIVLSSIADPLDHPDGELFDCTDANSLMTETKPIYIGNNSSAQHDNSGDNWLDLNDGWATRLKSGTRLFLQAHYINTGEQDIIVQDAANLTLVDPSTVTTWVAPFSHTNTALNLPPHQETELTIKCTFEQDANLMFVGGHMHEWGQWVTIDLERGEDSSQEELYRVDPWKIEYRDLPPQINYELGTMSVKMGDSLITTCHWLNDTDTALQFPGEMCANFGMMYPTVVPSICDVAE